MAGAATGSSWSAREKNLLKMLWPTADQKILERNFPIRTYRALLSKAFKLKIVRVPSSPDLSLVKDGVIKSLIQARLRKGWSRRKLSNKIGCQHNMVCWWEREEHLPSYQSLLDWAQALHCEIVIREIE
jgi:ribosome-binding protein aMBF1 (putative translation factor)